VKAILLSQDQISILGRPNFVCARNAQLLIRAGVYEDLTHKAEYQQAVFIHWALSLHDEYGSEWRERGNEILKQIDKDLNDELLNE
jgi:hypothetical protein